MNKLVRRIVFGLQRRTRVVRSRYFDRFVFIHINKTGGSSIERALNLPLEHRTALQKIEELGRKEWDSRFTFAFVRNPWDKVVSHYHYRVRTNQTKLGENPIGFKEWVQLTYGEQDPVFYDNPVMFMPQANWVVDEIGQVAVNFVGRFENLSRDFEYACQRLGRTVELPHVKASRHKPFTEYFDESTRQIVATWFAEDIENFGYEFWSAADTK